MCFRCVTQSNDLAVRFDCSQQLKQIMLNVCDNSQHDDSMGFQDLEAVEDMVQALMLRELEDGVCSLKLDGYKYFRKLVTPGISNTGFACNARAGIREGSSSSAHS